MSRPSDWPSGPLVDEIAGVLRERIIEGRYAARAPLSHRALAEELAVSRGVIGEALQMLRREGLVEIAELGGVTDVAAADRWVLLSACSVRGMIDGLAARLAALHAGPALRARCGEALGEQRAAVGCGDRVRYMRANVAFHAAVIDGAGNPLLRGQMWLVRCTSRSAMMLGLERLGQEIPEHEAILAAVSGGEPDRAEDAARAHVRATIEALERIGHGRRVALPPSERPIAHGVDRLVTRPRSRGSTDEAEVIAREVVALVGMGLSNGEIGAGSHDPAKAVA